jgi:hypothetical protein
MWKNKIGNRKNIGRDSFQLDVTNRAEFQADVTMIVLKWNANVRTVEIGELLLAQILTGHNLQAKLPSTVIRGVHDSLNMKHSQVQRAPGVAPTSGCTNISTIIEIIEINIIESSFAGQIRNHLSSNHYMSEKSPFCRTA